MMRHSYRPYASENGGGNKWKALLACTAGRPIDPDVFPEPKTSSSRRDRKTPLKEHRPSTRSDSARRSARKSARKSLLLQQQQQKQCFHDVENNVQNRQPGHHHHHPPETIVVVPFAERLKKVAVAPNSPSSRTTRGTATTISSGSGNDSVPRRHDGNYQAGAPPLPSLLPPAPPAPPPATTARTTTTAPPRSLPIPSLTINASSSFGEDVSFLSFQIDDEDATEETGIRLQEQTRQLQYWRRKTSECFDRLGIQHQRTATAFLELGLCHLRCEQYTAALDFFRTALRVFENQLGPNHLKVAKTLEAMGIAHSKGNSSMPPQSPSSSSSTFATTTNKSQTFNKTPNKAGLLLALNSFRKCFAIRYDVLGPTHIDTVETLNKIANIYMRLHMYSSAKNGYFEVLQLRTHILGGQHAGVAVAAQSLGIALLHLNDQEQAKAYFLQALNVFAMSGLQDHPMADQLRNDIMILGFDLDRVEI